jgi:prevent-host-death family protein
MSSGPEHLPLAEVKKRLSEVIDRLQREHGRLVITKHGKPAAVLVSIEDLESLEETLEVLSNPWLMAEISKAREELAASRATRLGRDEALALRDHR